MTLPGNEEATRRYPEDVRYAVNEWGNRHYPRPTLPQAAPGLFRKERVKLDKLVAMDNLPDDTVMGVTPDGEIGLRKEVLEEVRRRLNKGQVTVSLAYLQGVGCAMLQAAKAARKRRRNLTLR